MNIILALSSHLILMEDGVMYHIIFSILNTSFYICEALG